jgi:hypothetical protein
MLKAIKFGSLRTKIRRRDLEAATSWMRFYADEGQWHLLARDEERKRCAHSMPLSQRATCGSDRRARRDASRRPERSRSASAVGLLLRAGRSHGRCWRSRDVVGHERRLGERMATHHSGAAYVARALRRCPPPGAPLRGLPWLGDVDRLPGHLVAPELEDVHRELHRTAVVADRSLADPQVPPALAGCASRGPPPPDTGFATP